MVLQYRFQGSPKIGVALSSEALGGRGAGKRSSCITPGQFR